MISTILGKVLRDQKFSNYKAFRINLLERKARINMRFEKQIKDIAK